LIVTKKLLKKGCKVLTNAVNRETGIRYYFPGIMGFTASFITVMALFGFYKAQHEDKAQAAVRVSIPENVVSNTPIVKPALNAIALPAAVSARPPVVKEPEVKEKPIALRPPEEARPTTPQPQSQTLTTPVEKELKEEAKTEAKPEAKPETEKPDFEYDKALKKFLPGKIVRMEATAYCLNSVTASGVRSKYGIVAADPKLLPIGSIVRLYAGEYSGIYTVLDTGGKIKGRKLDIFLSNGKEATKFGRQKIRMEILRYGWNPQASLESAGPASSF
jgi:3D (Asp-Asp-Asp) domain-containing protein